MFDLLWLWFGVFLRLFRSRQAVLIENLALRQQLAVFKRRRRRPRLATMDKLFWVILRRFWSSWTEALIVVTPDTVVRCGAQRFYPRDVNNGKVGLSVRSDFLVMDALDSQFPVFPRPVCRYNPSGTASIWHHGQHCSLLRPFLRR